MLTDEKVGDTERQLVETLLEATFFDAIKDKIDEKELETLKLTSADQVDGYLFNKIPNFTTLLEEVTTDRLSDYLSEEKPSIANVAEFSLN
jgi:hypothetical protein